MCENTESIRDLINLMSSKSLKRQYRIPQVKMTLRSPLRTILH